jgi:hypothetical protein
MIAALLGMLVFAVACAAAIMVLATSIAPAWPRIVGLLRDGVDTGAPVPPRPAVASHRVTPRPVRVAFDPPVWRAAA